MWRLCDHNTYVSGTVKFEEYEFCSLECKRRLRGSYSAVNVSKFNEFENTLNGGNLNDEKWHETKGKESDFTCCIRGPKLLKIY